MFDIDYIRKYDQNFFDTYCAKRHLDPKQILALKELDEQVRNLKTSIQNKNALVNKLSSQFTALVKANDQVKLAALKAQVQQIKSEIAKDEQTYNSLSTQLTDGLMRLPNVPAEEVPLGLDEKENVPQKYFLSPTKFDFVPKAHWDLMVEHHLVDLKASQYICGSRFIVYTGLGARLIRALQWYTLDCNLSHGYTEVLPPVIVDAQALYNTSQLPKFQEDLFQLTVDNKYLSPTAEVQLTNMHAEEILKESDLPYHYTANTACFRSEAGSAGRDTRGVIRQHQFYKTELVKICKPENSKQEHEALTKDAEYILESLKLPYRRILLCSGDMGFGAIKTYDLEVWLPSYNNYKEISSCSNCGSFQARRMKMRVKGADGKMYYPHTLNGSALAIDRLFAAIVENYQQADGSIVIPEPLRKYMGGIEKI